MVTAAEMDWCGEGGEGVVFMCYSFSKFPENSVQQILLRWQQDEPVL